MSMEGLDIINEILAASRPPTDAEQAQILASAIYNVVEFEAVGNTWNIIRPGK